MAADNGVCAQRRAASDEHAVAMVKMAGSRKKYPCSASVRILTSLLGGLKARLSINRPIRSRPTTSR